MKTIVRSNWRVEVFPLEHFYLSDKSEEGRHKFMMREADDLLAQVRRHTDHHSANVAYDTEFVCAHCGHAWTEDSPTYNGGCCDEDEKNNPERIDE